MRGKRNQHGVALVLVLAVVAMVFVFSSSYMAQQTVSVQLTRNCSNRTQARMIAETALDLALTYVASDSNWKTTKTPGTWVQNVSLSGGTYAIIGQAGQDANGSGVIVGNGNFTADPTQALTLTAIGTYKEANWTSQSVLKPGGTTVASGIIVATTVSIVGGSVIDCFDSTLGPYGTGNCGTNSHVATNSTTAGAITINNGGNLKGSVAAGHGANASTIVANSGGTYTGTTTAMAVNIPMPTITVPDLGTAGGAVSYGVGTTTVSTNVHAASITLGGGGRVKISGNVIMVSEGTFEVGNGSTLEVLTNSSLKVYCKGALMLDGGSTSTMSVDGLNLDRLTFYNVGTTTVSLSNGSSLYGVIISPNAAVDITGAFIMCGAVIAKSLTIENGSYFHEDLRITGGTDGIPLSGTGTPKVRCVK